MDGFTTGGEIMKEFEKIFHRRIERTIKLSISMNNPGGMSKKEIAKLAWEEALEWAENQFVGNSAFEVEEAINRELREL